MLEQGKIDDLVRRIRAGDEQAAAELVREYEPLIRREVRIRLADRRLRRSFDSMDVCQSVWAGFFLRAAAGHYELDEPGQLIRLLVAIARNKVASAARRQHTLRRDERRLAPGAGDALDAVAAAGPSPSEIVGGAELLSAFKHRLSGEEQQIGDLRAHGRSWAEVAEQMGGTAPGRRVQWSRAVARAIRDLGVDEGELDDE
jgi:RNA polymerase sigma-70 factor (ECF subfamily)